MNLLFKYTLFLLSFLSLMVQTDDSFAQMRKTKEQLKQEENRNREIEKFKKSKVENVEYYENDINVGYSKFDSSGNCTENGNYSDGKRIPKNYFTYDSNNNMLTQSTVDSENKTVFLKKCRYDTLNRLVFFEESYPETGVTTQQLKKYDGNGNISEEEYILSSGTARYVFSYDENNCRTETKGYRNDSLIYKETLTYDGNRDLISDTEEFISGGLVSSSEISKFFYKYDERKNLVEFSKISSDSTASYSEQIEFDKNDNKISYSTFNYENKLEYKQTFSYDNKNNVTEIITYNKNQIDRKEIFFYNESGLMIKNSVFNSNSELRSELMKIYDARGNVTEELTEEGGKKNNYRYVYKYYE